MADLPPVVGDPRKWVDEILATSYTSEGVERWWHRPRKQLDGRTPQQAWETDPEKVVELAGWLLSPGAT